MIDTPSISNKVSILIASRNEPYTTRTIKDLLDKAQEDIEIICVMDGWEVPDPIEDPRVHYLYYNKPRGMRNALNMAVNLAHGEYLLKTDAHCMFSEGYDVELKKACEDNWVVVPRRYALDPENWKIEDNPKYPIDYMYLDNEMHGIPWTERNRDPKLEENKIDDLMSAQGSCWFMKKTYYQELKLLDEDDYGTFWHEFQEIGLKCWLSGGEVKVNKNVWYAHWHKPKQVGRGYSLSDAMPERARQKIEDWKANKTDVWHKQKYPLTWLINKFKPVPTWK